MSTPAGGNAGLADWCPPLLAYWFGELGRAQWFARDDAVDRTLHDRFGHLPGLLADADLDVTNLDARQALGAVLALDQLPRNLYRGTPQAFAYDAQALRLARAAVEARKDRDLSLHERLFLYLPFEHSEYLADQDMAVDLVSGLGDGEYTRYAIAHRRIVARFGRFPHRNAVLGRQSTPAEVAFLQEPGSSF